MQKSFKNLRTMLWVIPFFFVAPPHTEEYLREHSPWIFHLVLTHRIHLWKTDKISTTGPKDFAEILILIRQIGL